MPIKSTTTTKGERKGKEKRKKIEKNLQNKSKIRIISVFLESLLSESFPLVGVTVHLTSPGCPPTLMISGHDVGTAQILIWSYSCVFLPPMSAAIRTSVFSFMGALRAFYIFQRHRVCLVDHVDLIYSLYSWWEGLGSSSLATLLLGFNCGFISTSACGSSTGVLS